MSDDVPRWEPVPLALSYRVGESVLFRRRFNGLALFQHFFDLGDDPAVPRPPFERFRTGVEVIVTRSHPIAGALAVLTTQDGVLRYVLSRYTRFHTDLSGDFATYLAKFTSKSRGTLRRKVRRFAELGEGCEMREYRRPEEMEAFHRTAREVSVLTYQEKLLDAGIPTGADYLEELKAMATNDAVRAYLLFLHGKAIAYLCCPSTNDVLLYGYLGHNPKHTDLSPGAVLQYLAFESLFAEKRFRAFDFTEGQGEHKRFFGTHETACADICYFPLTPAARLWVGLHRMTDQVSVGGAALLDRLGVKARLKRFLRRL